MFAAKQGLQNETNDDLKHIKSKYFIFYIYLCHSLSFNFKMIFTVNTPWEINPSWDEKLSK